MPGDLTCRWYFRTKARKEKQRVKPGLTEVYCSKAKNSGLGGSGRVGEGEKGRQETSVRITVKTKKNKALLF